MSGVSDFQMARNAPSPSAKGKAKAYVPPTRASLRLAALRKLSEQETEFWSKNPKSRRGLSKSRRGTQSLGVAKHIPSIQSPRLGARSSSLGVETLQSSNQALFSPRLTPRPGI
ncbi:hypothetical protein PIB30_095816 [Stylosanthes scabra]|uniref:Uncharacterized protein n=1 Tax=Stylosanthes scabra TaxID=79078 RepID=A0ABU6QWG5_9FABA|nr:hypothetical protein [Stylosanthes scabra]